MKKVVLTFGIISGVIVSIFLLINMQLLREGMDTGEVGGYLTMIVALSMVFFGIKSFRDNYSGGQITFLKAVQVGILIALISSVMYAITWEIYYNTVAPDFMEKYTAQYLEKMKAGGSSASELDEMTKEMAGITEMYKNPVIRFGMTLMEIVPVGLLLTLISAAILKKNTTSQTTTA